MLLIRWEGPSDRQNASPPAGITVTAAVLFPPEVKRRLATIEAATRHALELARQAAALGLPRPPDLDRLICTIEVRSDEALPSGEPSLTTDEGTRVWLEKTGES